LEGGIAFTAKAVDTVSCILSAKRVNTLTSSSVGATEGTEGFAAGTAATANAPGTD
jgi:hypothetical protein